MLCPKGTQEGFPMDLFVMISDYEQDKVFFWKKKIICIIIKLNIRNIAYLFFRLIKKILQETIVRPDLVFADLEIQSIPMHKPWVFHLIECRM